MISSLKACKMCGSQAIEQVRGELTGDDKGYVAPGNSPVGGSSNNPANASDTRIICSNTQLLIRGTTTRIGADGETWNTVKLGDSSGMLFSACDEQTGWNKAQFADYTRFIWDRDHGEG